MSSHAEQAASRAERESAPRRRVMPTGKHRTLKGDLAIFRNTFLDEGGVIPIGPVAPTGDSEYGESSLAPAPANSELKRRTFEVLRDAVDGRG